MKKKYLTTQEIADELRRDRRTVQAWIKESKLKASKLGRDWLIEERDFVEFKNKHLIAAS